MSKPLPNRNREKRANGVLPLAPRILLQLLKNECTQKESNLQPASSDAVSNSRVIGFPPYRAGVTPAVQPPTKPESGEPNRYGSVTAPNGYRLSSHPIFPALEAEVLASMLAPTRTVKGWP